MAVESVLLLAGPEIGRRDRRIAELRARLAKEWGEAPEEHRRYAGDTPVEALLDLLRNGSLFSPGKLVLVFDAELFKGKAVTGPLAAYIKAPAERTTLVLVTETYGFDKALEDAAGKDRKTVYWELRDDEKERLARDWFRGAGLRIEDEALDALLSLVGSDSATIEAECGRIAEFLGAAGTVDAQTVEQYVARTRGVDAFGVFDLMARGDLPSALEALDAVLSGREGSGPGILAGLQWSMRRVSKMHALMGEGVAFDEACRRLRATSRKQLSGLDAARKRWPPAVCSELVAFGTDVDLALRSGGAAFERHFLSLYVYACAGKRAPVELARRPDSFLDPLA
ncbi:MAG TPA: hypothetical protein PKW82_05050 [Spirochaetales bacterium]|nr:hypothetical protein [Spirochaetales bacterium]